MNVKENMKVYIKPEELKGYVLKIGADGNTAYPVVGTIEDKLLIQVGVNLLDIFPSKVTVALDE